MKKFFEIGSKGDDGVGERKEKSENWVGRKDKTIEWRFVFLCADAVVAFELSDRLECEMWLLRLLSLWNR